ncbi:MAG: phosphoribosyl-AMP cyclohydrolase [Armatimonadota bacterium]
MSFSETLKYDANGLIPAVIQDAENGEVLMVGYMNRDAVDRTLETGHATFWSRSRQKFWVKGETSGHLQHVVEVRTDCDKDCLLVRVNQVGVACHDGFRSCFYRAVKAGELEVVEERQVDPASVYK